MKDRRDNTDISPIDRRTPMVGINLDTPSWDIYAIHAKGDPGDVWYVGQSQSIWQRMDTHEQSSKSQTHKPLYAHLSTHEWEYRVLEKVDTKDEARTAERRWIRFFLAEGKNLFNIRDRPHKPTQQERLKTKRKNAAEHGITLVEGAIVAVRGNEFSVYEWDEVNEDYVPRYTGVLDTFKK